MKDYAKGFYKSKAWQDCRNAYVKSVGGLCEECLKSGVYKPGVIVHHKIHITPSNIYDPNITLNPNNLILLCRDHHALMHSNGRRYRVDEFGRVKTVEI
jgi:5-methylcytosine-specific restriction endonuclease McrA